MVSFCLEVRTKGCLLRSAQSLIEIKQYSLLQDKEEHNKRSERDIIMPSDTNMSVIFLWHNAVNVYV